MTQRDDELTNTVGRTTATDVAVRCATTDAPGATAIVSNPFAAKPMRSARSRYAPAALSLIAKRPESSLIAPATRVPDVSSTTMIAPKIGACDAASVTSPRTTCDNAGDATAAAATTAPAIVDRTR